MQQRVNRGHTLARVGSSLALLAGCDDREKRDVFSVSIAFEILENVSMLRTFDNITTLTSMDHVLKFNFHPNSLLNPRLMSNTDTFGWPSDIGNRESE